MTAPSAELAATYAAELANYLPDDAERKAFTELVANAIWDDRVAPAFAEALLAVLDALTFATHDVVTRDEFHQERFRAWIADSLEGLAEQIANVEGNFQAMVPAAGHA